MQYELPFHSSFFHRRVPSKRMKSSLYLEQSLFYDQNSGTDLLFKERTGRLFELDEKASFVDVYVQLPPDQPVLEVFQIGVQYRSRPPEWNPESYFSSSLQPPTPVDHAPYLRQSPPKHVESPGLHLSRIWNSNDLEEVALVRSVNLVDYTVKLTLWEL